MWYFEEGGQTTGPVPEAELRAAVAAGRISRTTLVWRDGMGGWLPAERTELAAAFGGPPGMWTGGPPMLPPAYGAPGIVPAYAGPQGMRFAGFWIRLAAYVIDAILVQIGAYLLGALVGLVMAQAVLVVDRSLDLTNVQITAGAVGLVWAIVYYLVPQAGRWQATPGKRLLGLRVIRTDGQPIGIGLALGRWLSYFLSSIILGIGFLMIGWTDQKRGLHDMICSTRVVYGRA